MGIFIASSKFWKNTCIIGTFMYATLVKLNFEALSCYSEDKTLCFNLGSIMPLQILINSSFMECLIVGWKFEYFIVKMKVILLVCIGSSYSVYISGFRLTLQINARHRHSWIIGLVVAPYYLPCWSVPSWQHAGENPNQCKTPSHCSTTPLDLLFLSLYHLDECGSWWLSKSGPLRMELFFGDLIPWWVN